MKLSNVIQNVATKCSSFSRASEEETGSEHGSLEAENLRMIPASTQDHMHKEGIRPQKDNGIDLGGYQCDKLGELVLRLTCFNHIQLGAHTKSGL